VVVLTLLPIEATSGPERRDRLGHNVDDGFNEFARAQLDSADRLLFGRVTYKLIVSRGRLVALSGMVPEAPVMHTMWNSTDHEAFVALISTGIMWKCSQRSSTWNSHGQGPGKRRFLGHLHLCGETDESIHTLL
jgi:hypothetical protein